MKICKGCKYCVEPNESHDECLCLYFCEGVIPNQNCISEKQYYENLAETYERLEKDIDNLIKTIDSPEFNKRFFTFSNQFFITNFKSCLSIIQN